MKPLISLVTGTYNRLPHLQNMLSSLREACGRRLHERLEIIIVDGGSSDGTLEWLEGKPVTLIKHGELRGAIRAFNDGCAVATAPFVLLANDDISFHPHSIARALAHLDATPHCGAVAFADNRQNRQDYYVATMTGFRDGKVTGLNYAQVGLFRKSLGDAAGWWGADDPTFTARTYGGDNYLSARIWGMGYTVDAVEGAAITDHIVEDNLRVANMGSPHQQGGMHPDSQAFMRRFPQGPTVGKRPPQEALPTEHLRILYLPIYEHGSGAESYGHQVVQKRGLCDALSERGWVYELDYVGVRPDRLAQTLTDVMRVWRPHLLISQFHGAVFSPGEMALIRYQFPKLVWVNWNGDVWQERLTSPDVLAFLKFIDLQCVVNAAVLPTYDAQGINARYWQVAYEDVKPQTERVRPDVPDVVFLGNAYDAGRLALYETLSALESVGFWGAGFPQSRGQTLYDFEMGRYIYSRAKIAISDNLHAASGFVSNRFFEIVASGGAVCFQQHVPEFELWTGYQSGQHYIEWTDHHDLLEKIRYYLERPAELKRIAKRAQSFTRKHHSFRARVNQLFEFIAQIDKRPSPAATLEYIGPRRDSFGIQHRGWQQVIQPGTPFTVPRDVARALMNKNPELYREVKPDGD